MSYFSSIYSLNNLVCALDLNQIYMPFLSISHCKCRFPSDIMILECFKNTNLI